MFCSLGSLSPSYPDSWAHTSLGAFGSGALSTSIWLACGFFNLVGLWILHVITALSI